MGWIFMDGLEIFVMWESAECEITEIAWCHLLKLNAYNLDEGQSTWPFGIHIKFTPTPFRILSSSPILSRGSSWGPGVHGGGRSLLCSSFLLPLSSCWRWSRSVSNLVLPCAIQGWHSSISPQKWDRASFLDVFQKASQKALEIWGTSEKD